jgi:methionyl-tRNA formyltransferase
MPNKNFIKYLYQIKNKIKIKMKKFLLITRHKDIHSKKLVKDLKKKFIFDILWSKKIGEKIIIKENYDFIFCFRSYYILKKNYLKKSSINAINFHPGPPKYRGVGCANFALLNDEKFYGITCHIINEKIDNGKIIFYKKFKIHKKNDLKDLLDKTHKELLLVAKKLIPKIVKDYKIIPRLKKKFEKRKWSKILYTKSILDNLYKINYKTPKNKIKKILRATYLRNSKYKPIIEYKD